MKKKFNLEKHLFTLPVIIYSLLLILLPILYILLISFYKSDSYGGMIYTFTLSNYIEIFNITYLKILLKSSLIALIATLICICISYPFALILRERDEKTRNFF